MEIFRPRPRAPDPGARRRAFVGNETDSVRRRRIDLDSGRDGCFVKSLRTAQQLSAGPILETFGRISRKVTRAAGTGNSG
jgi:hypothetical protein